MQLLESSTSEQEDQEKNTRKKRKHNDMGIGIVANKNNEMN